MVAYCSLSVVSVNVLPTISVVTRVSTVLPPLPTSPVSPLSPLAPLGIPKLSVKLGVSPVILAVALVPASKVVTAPIDIFGV